MPARRPPRQRRPASVWAGGYACGFEVGLGGVYDGGQVVEEGGGQLRRGLHLGGPRDLTHPAAPPQHPPCRDGLSRRRRLSAATGHSPAPHRPYRPAPNPLRAPRQPPPRHPGSPCCPRGRRPAWAGPRQPAQRAQHGKHSLGLCGIDAPRFYPPIFAIREFHPGLIVHTQHKDSAAQRTQFPPRCACCACCAPPPPAPPAAAPAPA